MGECVRKCKRNVGGIAVMEVDHGGLITGTMETINSGASKRMKIDSENFEHLSSNMRLRNHGYLVNSPATLENSDQLTHPGDLCSSSSSDQVLASCCSSNECLRSVDLEQRDDSIERVCGDSDEMESTGKKSTASHRKKPPAEKMPSTVEIEEFFTVVEKYEQKRFAEKYNYDVVKDMPL